ncbi:monocarboxylate transporter 9-like [Pecten maximus]|uniref:monocarboxylate transporter 9-like n=1 Tax=Pecten maximus TaxID=6579 RepID=UPI0014591AE9|nr:monocarboxylate transporter 9-like [Pecten maximus]
MFEGVLIEMMSKPDGGWGWMVAFSSFILNVLMNGIFLTYGIFFPAFLKHFDESPVVSVLVNKYDIRKVVAVGTVITSGGLFLSSFSQSLNVLLIFYSIVGGFFIPSNFLPVWASDVNLSTEEGAFLISAMGASNTIGRVLIGYITDKPWANCLIINNIALLIGGLATCFVPFYTTFETLVIYAVVFGISMAVFIVLGSILMAELLGEPRLNSSFGLVGLSIGLSAFVGSPLAGALSDIIGNYNVAFYFGGITMVLGGLICLLLRRISNWEISRRKDFNLCDRYDDDQKNKKPGVKIVSVKKKLSVFTISDSTKDMN